MQEMKALPEAKAEPVEMKVEEPLQMVPVSDGDAARDDPYGPIEIDCPSPSSATLASLVLCVAADVHGCVP